MRQDHVDAKAIGPSDPHDLDAGLAPVVAKAPGVTGSAMRIELLAKGADWARPSPRKVPAEVTFRAELAIEPVRFRVPATTFVGPL